MLGNTARAAWGAHRAAIITPERSAAVEAMLAEALTRACLPSDIIIRPRERVRGGGNWAYGYHSVELAEPMLLPNGKRGFHSGEGSGLPLPAQKLPYFDDLVAIDDAKKRDFMNAQH